MAKQRIYKYIILQNQKSAKMLFLPYIGNFTIYKMFVVLIICADLSEILNMLGAKKTEWIF